MSASEIIKQVVALGQENKTLQENLDKAIAKNHEHLQKISDLLMSQTAEMRIHELEEQVKKLEGDVKRYVKCADDESTQKCRYHDQLVAIQQAMENTLHGAGDLTCFTKEELKWENIPQTLTDHFEACDTLVGEHSDTIDEYHEFIDDLAHLQKTQFDAFQEKMKDCPCPP